MPSIVPNVYTSHEEMGNETVMRGPAERSKPDEVKDQERTVAPSVAQIAVLPDTQQVSERVDSFSTSMD